MKTIRIGSKIEYRYEIAESTVLIEGEEQKTYGILQLLIDNFEVKQLAAVYDISPIREDVIELIERLDSQELDEAALLYVVEDFVAELSMASLYPATL